MKKQKYPCHVLVVMRSLCLTVLVVVAISCRHVSTLVEGTADMVLCIVSEHFLIVFITFYLRFSGRFLV